MTRWLLAAACLSCLSACATTQQTAMIECPSGGCPSVEPLDPVTQMLHERASSELACPVEKITFTLVGADTLYGSGPWEAKGCGQEAMYRYHDDYMERTTFVVKAPPQS